MVAFKDIPAGALHIVQTLRQAGYGALLAGGCVRDAVLGHKAKDWDVATDAGPEQVMGLFARTVAVGARFGVVLVRLADGDYEVARFRRDGDYVDGRRPQEVAFAGPEEDALRRDFTVNGMFYDPLAERLLDYVGGQEDIARKVLRAIGDPLARFGEDHLRLLRAVRFAARLGFAIDPATWEAMQACAPRIGAISAERVRDELTAMLTEGHAARALELLHSSGLLAQVLPEVAAMDGVQQPPQFHPEGDVWTHVRLMLDKMGKDPDPQLAWGVLLHDIGKPPTYEEADRIRFNGHDAVGARLADGICHRLRMGNEPRQEIVELVAQHMRFRNVKEMRPSKLKRFLRQPYIDHLLELHRLDCLGSHAKLDLYQFCQEKLHEAEGEALRPARVLNGRDLIELGFAPGRVFKEILEGVEDEQLEGRVHDREGAVAWVLERYGGLRGA